MLTQYDIEEVQEHVSRKFSQLEIVALYDRFCALDRSGKGYITADEFLAIPEFALNPLANRMLRMMEGVNFKDFVFFLSAFSGKATPEDKARFIFRIYDVDGNGQVSRDDIRGVLQDLSGTFLSEEQSEQVISRALEEAGFAQNCSLSFADFCQVLGSNVKMEVEIPCDML